MVRTILIAGIRFQSGCDNLLRQLERTSKIFLAERGRNSESGCIVIVVGRVVETINHDAVAFDVPQRSPSAMVSMRRQKSVV